MKRHVRHVLKDEKPTIWIGKEGYTPQLSGEIENQLSKHKMVKVRILPSALQSDTAKAIAIRAAEEAGWLRLEGTFSYFTDGTRSRSPNAVAF